MTCNCTEAVDQWIAEHAAAIADRAERELEALVGVSSPSGDVRGARGGRRDRRRAAARRGDDRARRRAPRPTTRRPARAPARHGQRRLLLLGHLDTVVAHAEHRPLKRDGDQPLGSGTIDMKGGDVLALGVLRALATRAERFAEVALLLVVDEEWRVGPFGHVDRFAGFDACLCFEAGELAADDHDAVVVRRKAAGTIEVRPRPQRALRLGARQGPQRAARARRRRAGDRGAATTRTGADHLTAVPTVVARGDAFNVVPAPAELISDVRADRLDAFDGVLAAVPAEVGGARSTRGSCASGPDGRARGDRARCCGGGRARSAGRSSAAPAAAPATPATSRRRSRSPSTASARAAAARTRPTSTCSPRRCAARGGRAGRRARGAACVTDGRSDGAFGRSRARKSPNPPTSARLPRSF